MTVLPALPQQLSDLAQRASASPEVTHETVAAENALFAPGQSVAPEILSGLAARVAAIQGSPLIAAWHLDQGADEDLAHGRHPEDPGLRALARHVDLITVSPALATAADQLALQTAGITDDQIVLISQLVAFLSYQIRLLHGYQLITGTTTTGDAEAVHPTGTVVSSGAEGRSKDLSPTTGNGYRRPTAYTQDVLAWDPWISAPEEADLTDIQKDSFAAKATTNSVYFRLLSRAPGILKARSAIDNAVFLPGSALSRAERELAATVASKVNDCIYCASVHSRKASFQSKRTADVQRLLDTDLPRNAQWQPTDLAPLSAGQEGRWAAVVGFAAHLSTLIPSADATHLAALRDHDLDDRELSDLVGATAFFAWANRLMLTLGEAYIPHRDT